MEAFVFLLH